VEESYSGLSDMISDMSLSAQAAFTEWSMSYEDREAYLVEVCTDANQLVNDMLSARVCSSIRGVHTPSLVRPHSVLTAVIIMAGIVIGLVVVPLCTTNKSDDEKHAEAVHWERGRKKDQ